MSMTFDQMQVLIKTDLGRQTIEDRSVALPRAARTILLLVDGRSTVEKLQKFISATRAPEKTLEELESKGLITSIGNRVAAPVAPVAQAVEAEAAVGMEASEITRFDSLYYLMCEVCATFLGVRGYFLQLKIERCANASELLGLRHDLVESIANRHGADVAKDISHRIRDLA